LFSQPYLTVGQAKDLLDVTHRAADLNVKKLVEAGILHEEPLQIYNRIFVARGVMAVLDANETN